MTPAGTPPYREPVDRVRSWLAGRLRAWLVDATWVLAALTGAALGGVALVALALGVIVIPVFGIGIPVVAGALGLLRTVAGSFRGHAGDLLGADLAAPYASEPGWSWTELQACVRDPQTWRDLVWVGANGALAFAATLAGGILLYIPMTLLDGSRGAFVLLTLPSMVPLAVLWWLVPWVRFLFAQAARLLLVPSDPRLAERVSELAASRAQTVDARAAELRRIERDLHDGAQARLAALTMTLGLADQLMRTDPEGSRALLREAREDARCAQTELRDLVRGIHPPVLADRGLAGGLEAAALLCPVPVRLDVVLPHRPPEPVESALYFAAAEALANVGRHACATTAWLRAGHDDGVLSVVVGDDGRGGADPSAGTGLRGIARRLAPFDGTCRVSSPPCGPTEITMELPWPTCAPSSPRTTSSCATG